MVVRGAKRELISRCYNLLLRATLGARFSDAQCGFKAIRADRARELLPLVEDTGWFFDTELLVLAERSGLRIHEVPVDWLDDPDSRVAIAATALADLKGIARPLARPVPRPARAAGRTSTPRDRPARTAAALRSDRRGQHPRLPRAVPARPRRDVGPGANALSLLVTAVANTAANRRLTFGVRGAAGRLRHQGQGLAVFALAWP